MLETVRKIDVPLMPGVATPSEAMGMMAEGLRFVKFFPAEAMGGVQTLKAFHGPYAAIRFMPTGGVTAANLLDYLRLPFVLACGGSWMVKSDFIAEKRFDEITRLTKETMQLDSHKFVILLTTIS